MSNNKQKKEKTKECRETKNKRKQEIRNKI